MSGGSPNGPSGAGGHGIIVITYYPLLPAAGTTHLDMYHTVTSALPTCAITATPTSIVQGGSSTLTWTSTNATSCTGGNFSTAGATNNTSPGVSVSPQNTTTYTASCTGAGGSVSCNSGVGVVLTVTCTPSTVYTCVNSSGQGGSGPGYPIIRKTVTDAACNVTSTNTSPSCEAPGYCSPGYPICLYPQPVVKGHLHVSPQIVHKGSSTTVSWDPLNVGSCTVKSSVPGGDSWSGTSGTQISSPLTEQTTYTLSCLGLDGSTVNESVLVGIIPIYNEQ